MADIPRGKSTNVTVTLGETFRSQIGSFGDRDWVRIKLKKGDWVEIDLEGRGANALEDPFLRVFDASGTKLAVNDDATDTSMGLNSQLTFGAIKSGTYYIEASGLDGDYKGKYQITTRAVAAPPAEESLYWGTQMDSPVVTVYFAPDGETYDGYTSEGFNAYEKEQFQKAFDMITAVSGLTFQIGNDPDADFKLVLDTNEIRRESDPFLGQFNPPGFGGNDSGVGVFNGHAWDRQADGNLDVGGEAFVTVTHELLHGLGMAHPHDNGGGSSIMPGVRRAFDDYGNYDLNQGIFTTMSYNSGYFTGSPGSGPRSNFGFEAGPMALDIAVLQSLYGTGGPHKDGNTTYRLPGRNEQGTYWESIWDTGGNDTLSYGGNRDAVLDLRAATLEPGVGAGGFVSAAKGIAGGFTIAHGARIENATSGTGDDELIGNALANVLRSNAGADDLRGRGGNDTLRSGAGWDTLAGGSGADQLQAGAGDDLLRGGQGRDVLAGGDGADLLSGGAGQDQFDFNSVNDSRTGAANRDQITDFGRGDDRIDVTDIDADTTRSGNQAFDFIGSDAFSDAGQLRAVQRGNNQLVQADRNGDGAADFEILLRGAEALGASDFIL